MSATVIEVAICSKCNMIKEKRKGRGQCRECENSTKRDRYNQDPEHYREYNKIHYSAENRHKYYEQNKTKECERGKIYRQKNQAKTIYTYAKRRAKDKNLEFNITVQNVQNEINKAKGICPALGIKIGMSNKRMDPHSQSLDRINNSYGYTPDNICIISNRANILKRDASIDELEKITEWMRSHKLSEVI